MERSDKSEKKGTGMLKTQLNTTTEWLKRMRMTYL
jgi:hypothetical protein